MVPPRRGVHERGRHRASEEAVKDGRHLADMASWLGLGEVAG